MKYLYLAFAFLMFYMAYGNVKDGLFEGFHFITWGAILLVFARIEILQEKLEKKG